MNQSVWMLVVTTFAIPACMVDDGEAPTTDSRAADADILQVDEQIYSRAEFALTFGSQDLHWVITDETLEHGIPTAFTTEEKRNASLGLDPGPLASSATGPGVTDLFATLYGNPDRTGRQVSITGHAFNLSDQGFNDQATSVDTFSRDIVLYEHINHSGCSLFVQRQKYISHLASHDFCGAFTGDWNNKTSSVAVVGI